MRTSALASLLATGVVALLPASAQAAPPGPLAVYQHAVSQIQQAEDLRLSVRRGDLTYTVWQDRATGQRMVRRSNGKLQYVSISLWPGYGERVSGHFQQQPGRPCWDAFGYASLLRADLIPFTDLQTAAEQIANLMPQISKGQVRRLRSTRTRIRLRITRPEGVSALTMEVAARSHRPLRVSSSYQSVRLSFAPVSAFQAPAEICR